jgi:hypothetical protein
MGLTLPSMVEPTSFKTRLVAAILVAWLIKVVMETRGVGYLNEETTSSYFKSEANYKMAYDESLGFFDGVPKWDWIRQKQISKQKVHVGPIEGLKVAREIYENVWESDFSCRHEVMVGPMKAGHKKWVCDPHRPERIHLERLQKKGEGCLIYSIGCNGIFTFEEAILEIMPFCQIVIVDPKDYSAKIPAAIQDRVIYNTNALAASGFNLKEELFRDITITLPKLLEQNGHTGRTVDIFKIDCEGCEWTAYHDFLKADLRQILIEVHRWVPQSSMFFQAMYDNGYAIFHKESNTVGGAGGHNLKYGFLKLEKRFQTLA